MTPSRKQFGIAAFFSFLFIFVSFSMARTASAQSVAVNSASPASAAQGTLNLNVTVSGKGFRKGAAAKWFVTGTTNPGGVTVNSTTFVSSSQLTANITVSSTATISGFDIVVTNADGGSGKGTDLFDVVQSGSPNSCTIQPLPSGISLVGSLNFVTPNGGAAFGPSLGHGVRARQMTLGGKSVLVVAVGAALLGSTNPATAEIFFIDPATGAVLDGTAIGTNTAPQPHLSISRGSTTGRTVAVGDVNGDGIPDFTMGSAALVGALDGNGVLTYQMYPLPVPANAAGEGSAAMGDLNGDGNDEIAKGFDGTGQTPFAPGEVALFSWNGSGFTNYQNVVDPLPNKRNDEEFGHGVAIADVAGAPTADLIVGAPNATINGNTAAGRVVVFPGPVNGSYLSVTSGIKNDNLGLRVAARDVDGDANIDGYADLLSAAAARALGYYGPVSNNQGSSFTLQPVSSLTTGWATNEPDVSDVNGDGLADVIIGAPNASSGPVCGGLAYLWLSSSGNPLASRLVLSTPAFDAGTGPSTFQVFGWAAGFGPGTRLIFVTDKGKNVGTTANAGQVYIYKVN